MLNYRDLTVTYAAYVMEIVLVLSLLALATDLLAGHLGRVGLSAVTFAGIGAYSYAYLTVRAGCPIWPAVGIGIIAASLIAIPVGLVLLRLREDLFLLASFAMHLGLVDVANNSTTLGGPLGFINVPSPALFGLQVDATIGALVVLGTSTVLFILFLSRLLRKSSATREIIHSIRDDVVGAEIVGLDTRTLSMSVFVLHAAVSGAAGVGFVIGQGYVGPKSFDLWLALLMLTAVFVGGTGGSPAAMLLGASIVVGLSELVATFIVLPALVGPVQQLTFSVLLVCVFIVRKRGLAGPPIVSPSEVEREI